jgi:hypothetical protein
VSGDPDIEFRARARPVGDAPVDALLAIADELARRWAIELMNERSLQELADNPMRDLLREGPALCAGVIRALGSDLELERLLAGGPPGSREPSSHAHGLSARARLDNGAAVREVEALRGVVWEALLAELRWPVFERSTARMAIDLSDRLAHICSTLLSAMLASSGDDADERSSFTAVAEREQILHSSPPTADGRPAAVLVDERSDGPRMGEVPRRRPQDRPAAAEGRERFGEPALDASEARRRAEAKNARTRPRALPWGSPPPAEPAPELAPREEDHDSAAGQDPVMRIRRGPAAPVDERP